MRLVLAVALPKAVLPQVAALRETLAPLGAGEWLDPAQLAVRLLDLGEVSERHRAAAQLAVDKAAAAHQGFAVTVHGLAFTQRWGRARDAYLVVTGNAGMLQALAFSALRRLPVELDVRPQEPWRPKLLLARFPHPPASRAQLAMQAAAAGPSFEFNVREVALLQEQDGVLAVAHAARLPG